MAIKLRVNQQDHVVDCPPNTLLVEALRDTLRLTGTHVGCDTSQCGACTVHVDGKSVKSCTMLAIEAEGREITTIEGLATGGAELKRRPALHRPPCDQPSLIVWRNRPTPVISTSTVSPGNMNSGGVRAAPTPPGVPVTITSPGSSGAKVEM